MSRQAIRYLKPGAIDNGAGVVTFSLFAPEKRSVHLIGEFNHWDRSADPMHPASQGMWWIEKNLEPGAHSYQFLLDGETVICDPYARAIAEGAEHDPPRAVVEVGRRPFVWRHDNWRRPAFKDLIIYELHVGDFTTERSFQAVIEKLDYLKDLGINAIELMPVFEFVGEEASWGYDPSYFFTVETDYGTPDEFRTLIDEAHARGIAIIMDTVLAHTSARHHPFLKMYPFDQSPWYGSSFGEKNRFGLPMLDYSKKATQAFVRDINHYWLQEFHVDGFRYDYLIGIGQKDDMGAPWLVKTAREAFPEAYLIGEYSPEKPDNVEATGLDGAWHVAARYALMSFLREGKLNEYDWNDFEHVFAYLDPRNQGYARATNAVNFLESHDEWRIAYELCSIGFDIYKAHLKSALGASILFTIPGQPMIYHGQEWGEPTECILLSNPIHWDRLETKEGRKLFEHYRKMAWLRREHPALKSENFAVEAIYPELKSVVYRRWSDDGDQVVTAVNFTQSKQTVTVPFPKAGKWREFLSSEDIEVQTNMSCDMEPLSAKIFIPA
jgi:1,4-alpha-glucan branching enzyme